MRSSIPTSFQLKTTRERREGKERRELTTKVVESVCDIATSYVCHCDVINVSSQGETRNPIVLISPIASVTNVPHYSSDLTVGSSLGCYTNVPPSSSSI
ncbi:hypothetical protein EPI10_021934 [Gossypium australe]|uniref:Uncharacterized protein n=1 Tax=Gossypium australe TaxID=47621 RepID=A0A5B6WK82_9ROSI|nr:hypothetical protein EPI10_021934 [Gossypium australe]